MTIDRLTDIYVDIAGCPVHLLSKSSNTYLRGTFVIPAVVIAVALFTILAAPFIIVLIVTACINYGRNNKE